jgi:hypothetical protein
MYSLLIGGLFLIALGVVLVIDPMQLFYRNGPDTVKAFKDKKIYLKTFKTLGYVFLAAGSLLEVFYLLRYSKG